MIQNVERRSGEHQTHLAGSGPSRPPLARIGALLVIALILVLTGLLYVVRSPRPALLRLRLSPGQTSSYRLAFTVNGTATTTRAETSPYRLTVVEVLSWRVAAVDGHGLATVELTVRRARVEVNGKALTADPTPAATRILVASDGRMLQGPDPSVTFAGLAGNGFPGLAQLTPILTSRAVAPGEGWFRTFEQTISGRGSLANAWQAELTGYQNVDGVRTAVIDQRARIPVGLTLPAGAPSSSVAEGPTVAYRGLTDQRATVWLDADRGRVMRTTSSGSLDLTLSFQGFPSVFPSLNPGTSPSDGGLGSLGLPFGSGPGSGAGSGGDSLRVQGRFTLRLDPAS